MALFDEKVSSQLKGILGGLKDKVNILYFTQEIECNTCRDTHAFVNEISGFSDRLHLTVFDFVKDSEKAAYYKVDKIPAIVLLDSKDEDTGIRFFGLPGGYEINSFLQALMETSGVKEALPDPLMKRIAAIKKDVHLQVFVTLSCPYCPGAVTAAHRLALENKNIRADMVESSTFVPLSVKFEVQSVPKTVINDMVHLTGAQPLEKLVEAIEKF